MDVRDTSISMKIFNQPARKTLRACSVGLSLPGFLSLRIVRLRLQFTRAFWFYIFRINIVLFRLMESHVYTLQIEMNDRTDDHFRRSIADVCD